MLIGGFRGYCFPCAAKEANMAEEKKPEPPKQPKPPPKEDEAHRNRAPEGQPATVVIPPNQR